MSQQIDSKDVLEELTELYNVFSATGRLLEVLGTAAENKVSNFLTEDKRQIFYKDFSDAVWLVGSNMKLHSDSLYEVLESVSEILSAAVSEEEIMSILPTLDAETLATIRGYINGLLTSKNNV